MLNPAIADWHEKLKKHDATLYIKPTMKRHDSGYRCFEVGYLECDGEPRMKAKLVLGEYSDHIALDFYATLIEKRTIPINMDLTLDGYIRIWDNTQTLKWKDDCGFSSMLITTFAAEEDREERMKKL